MGREDTSKIEYWKKHITAGESHPKGLSAYFREQGLNSSSFYLWRHRIKGEAEKTNNKPGKKKAREKIPLFLPVLEAMPKYPEQQRCSRLPDAKWLAEIILAVHARCG